MTCPSSHTRPHPLPSPGLVLRALNVPMMEIEKGEVVGANAALRALVGAQEPGGEVSLASFTPHSRGLLTEALSVSAANRRAGHPFRLTLIHRAGRALEVRGVLLPTEDGSEETVTLALRPLEEERSQSGAAPSLADINHNLKNIQNNLLSSMRLMDRKVWQNGHDQAFLRCWGVLKSTISRMGRLIQNIASCEVDGWLCPETTNLGDLLGRVIAECRQCAEEHHTTIRVVNPGRPIWVSLDPERIHSVLLNLIHNGIESLCEAGQRDGLIEISLGSDDAHAWIAVADNGPGIRPDLMGRIFEPMFTTKESGGTGLGLSSVRHAMEAHGGQVTAENVASGGARFTLLFPCAPGEPAVQPMCVSPDGQSP